MRSSIKALVAVALLSSAAPAFAQDAEATPDLTVTGGVTLTTDYRFRGVSQSAEDIAVQGTINLNHSSGFYAGAWASSIDEDTIAYGHTELDLYAGWTGEVTPGLTADVGVLYYIYPNAPIDDTDFIEVYGSLRGSLGPATVKVGVNYAFDQAATFSDDNVYLYTDLTAAIPDTPITLVGHLGYSDGSLARFNTFSSGVLGDSNYLDWALGADISLAPVTLGVRYVDTDLDRLTYGSTRHLADAALIVSVTASF